MATAFTAAALRPAISGLRSGTAKGVVLQCSRGLLTGGKTSVDMSARGWVSSQNAISGSPLRSLRVGTAMGVSAAVRREVMQTRIFTSSRIPAQDHRPTEVERAVEKTAERDLARGQQNDQELLESEFGRSEKASRAAQINLRARLHKDGLQAGSKPGSGELRRLLSIARPEARWLGGMFTEIEGCWLGNTDESKLPLSCY